jgi:hypothetical protein
MGRGNLGNWPHPMRRGASISECGLYRYHLWRRWQEDAGVVCWIMLNPSTADGEQDDATIRRCLGFTKAWGFGALEVVNLFALRSTDPLQLKLFAADPVGRGNDDWILSTAMRASKVICAWGAHGKLNGRGDEVVDMLQRNNIWGFALAVNDDGTPGHPLFLPAEFVPQPYPVLV